MYSRKMNNEREKPILLGYWPGKRWKQARAVFGRGGLCPTLTAEMGGHGNNYVYVTEDEDGLQDGRNVADEGKR